MKYIKYFLTGLAATTLGSAILAGIIYGIYLIGFINVVLFLISVIQILVFGTVIIQIGESFYTEKE